MLYDAVKDKVVKRCQAMDIQLGEDFIDPVTILCKHAKEGEQKGIWLEIIKLHLARPEVDGINLLKGLRPFILRLDNDEPYLGKVCKGYDAIAGNNNLSVLIKSENLEGVKAQDLFKEILENSFTCSHDFEITSVQKSTSQRHACIVAPIPQAKKIELHQIPVPNQELLSGRSSQKISVEDKVKKDCLTLSLYRLPKLLTVDATSEGIKQKMGEKNVVSIWYDKQDEAGRHGGSANVQCLNSIVYRQFVNKTLPIGGYYVEFKPHWKSLEGTIPSSEDTLRKYGYLDTNIALVNTIETLNNQAQAQAQASITKEDIESIVGSIVEEAVEKGGKKLREEIQKERQVEMAAFETTIVKAANAYATNLHEDVKKQIRDIQTNLSLALKGLQQLTGPDITSSQDLLNPE